MNTWSKYYSHILILLVGIACSSKTETSNTELSTPSQEPIALSGSVEEGKILFQSCAACHGAAGEGNANLNAPTLANMDSWYIYRQLMNFRKDIRGASTKDTLGLQMATMAKTLRDSIAVQDVVAYIGTLPSTSHSPTITGDVTKGKQIFQTICGSCHGPSGIGNVKMNAPGLTNLEDWYLKRQIYNFKDSIRGAHPQDFLGAQMIPMMALLPDSQAIDNVIAYIVSIEKPKVP